MIISGPNLQYIALLVGMQMELIYSAFQYTFTSIIITIVSDEIEIWTSRFNKQLIPTKSTTRLELSHSALNISFNIGRSMSAQRVEHSDVSIVCNYCKIIVLCQGDLSRLEFTFAIPD